jgi:hypothetical protein
MNRTILVALFLLLPALAAAGEQRVRIESTDEFSFEPSGTIEIRNSFGQVRIEPWDRDVIQLRIIKQTQKKYEAHEEVEAREHLDRIRIATTLLSPSRLMIETELPSWSLFSRPLKGKTNIDLQYHIKAPRRANLEIRHDIGEVVVSGIAGDIGVTNRIGAISLRLPPSESYSVDARARIGDVSSEFDPPARRKILIGAALAGERHSAANYRVYARVGIGEVSVRRMLPD